MRVSSVQVGKLVVALAWKMRIVPLIGWILVGVKNPGCEGFHPVSSVKIGLFKAAIGEKREGGRESKLSSSL